MAAPVSEIRKTLEKKDKRELLIYLSRLLRLKKENKEFLSFILFEADDLNSFVRKNKEEVDLGFKDMNTSHVYFIKKSIRRILKELQKNIRFAESKEVEAELLLYFCNCFKVYHIPVNKSRQLQNIYNAQFKKAESAFSSLHSDLQYDLKQMLEK